MTLRNQESSGRCENANTFITEITAFFEEYRENTEQSRCI